MGEAHENFTRRTLSYLTESQSTVLNTVDVWTCDSVSVSEIKDKPWLIYIHGGAWRDPEVDSKSFEKAVHVLEGTFQKGNIAGFASINYRLSPYPTHPRSPSSPDDPARNVHSPSHVQDVASALIYLDDKYSISDRYLLAGHSAGGTMAFQLGSAVTDAVLPQPICVLGISGIYDLESFVESHSGISAYRELTENAFPRVDTWKAVSPASTHYPGKGLWENAKAVIISHSKDDGLVEDAQASYMLARARSSLGMRDNVHFLEATGPHDGIWESGTILAELITKSLAILQPVAN